MRRVMALLLLAILAAGCGATINAPGGWGVNVNLGGYGGWYPGYYVPVYWRPGYMVWVCEPFGCYWKWIP